MKTIHIILIIIYVIIFILTLFTPLSIIMIPFQVSLPFHSFEPSGVIYGKLDSSGRNINNSTDPYLQVYSKKLESSKFIPLGSHHGPETISFSSTGTLYYCVKNGEIRSMDPPFRTMSREEFLSLNDSSSNLLDNSKLVTVVGRALGIKIDKYDNIVIADSLKGLLYYNTKTDQLTILVGSYQGIKLTFVNDVEIDDENEIIYFSDSTSIAPVFDNSNDWNTLYPTLYTCLSQVPHGSVFSYNMKTKELKLIISGLRYSNGVSLDPKKESLFVVETCTARILRHWFTGINKGKTEIFIDNLPGFPDGIDTVKNEIIIGIFGSRSKIGDLIQPYPLLKYILFQIPFITLPEHIPSIVKADCSNGKITNFYFDNGKIFKSITSTTTHDNKLYLGNLLSNFIGVLDH